MNDANHPDIPSLRRHGPDETAYLPERVDAHRRRADQAEGPGSKMIHIRLAPLYRERADQVDRVLINQQ